MGNSKSYNRELLVKEMPQSVRQLHLAVRSNNIDTVTELVSRGVNVNFPLLCGSNQCIKDGNTPLIIAVSLNHTDIIQMLLRAGAYINKCDRNGCTPVYKAAFHGRPSLIDLLTKAGADVNLADFQGKTPLYICVNNAIVHACTLAILKLLSAGAIVDKCDRQGQAPIHMAAHWKLVDVLSLLVSAKSNVDLSDERGRTPVYMCLRSLTTKLYLEDLRLRLPCIVALFRASADMLNLVEWLLHKGPGIPRTMLEKWPDFAVWYTKQLSQPMSLANMCRKVVQMRLSACLKAKQKNNSVKRASNCNGYHSNGGYYLRYHHDNNLEFYNASTSFIPPSILQSKAAQSLSRCFPLTSDSTPVPIVTTTVVEDRRKYEGLMAEVRKLPVPLKLQVFLSRKMFFKENCDATNENASGGNNGSNNDDVVVITNNDVIHSNINEANNNNDLVNTNITTTTTTNTSNSNNNHARTTTTPTTTTTNHVSTTIATNDHVTLTIDNDRPVNTMTPRNDYVLRRRHHHFSIITINNNIVTCVEQCRSNTLDEASIIRNYTTIKQNHPNLNYDDDHHDCCSNHKKARSKKCKIHKNEYVIWHRPT